jgi:hypothetical protein
MLRRSMEGCNGEEKRKYTRKMMRGGMQGIREEEKCKVV